MRILFMPAPAIGHAFPLVPLAWAFRNAGHDVVFVTGADAVSVAQAGLPVYDALPGFGSAELEAQFATAVPEIFAPIQASSTEEHLAAMNERKPLILAAWDPVVDQHVALAERLAPDLVVYDPIFGVGPIVAALCGVPAVAHGIGIFRYTPDMLRELPAAVALQRHGVTVPDGITTIDVAPPSLAEGPASPVAMRYTPYSGGGVLPDWLLTPPERPRIAVTVGSLVPRTQGFAYVERIAAAAKKVDAEFVVTLGDSWEEQPHWLPPNIRTTGWVPLSALLRTCAAVIHHGGDGTVLTSCAMGVPQLVLPNGPDRLVNAEVLRARGAAHVVRDDELDHTVIDQLLADGDLHGVASELREEIASLPGPAAIASDLLGQR
ncbi:nucleotide disphospho-sugar-binding domain-containing protein [Haloechinothrix salitolerans]|uniref:Nucleotide disphospho-sugar-binding domain-containing protein n=1 Tax=Haloechinothrix salitolerans TaxID=926830 RepID=A0ABW2BWW5_9PSEU